MIPGLIIEYALKGFGFVKQAFQAALGFAKRNPWQFALIVALALCAWLWRSNNHLRDNVRREKERSAQLLVVHNNTVKAYRAAGRRAQEVQDQNLIRVAQAYTDINVRKENEIKADRDRAIAGYKRLLANAESYRSTPGNADLSAVTDAACIAYSGTRCAELPAKLKAAQDNTDQLVALIDWAKSISVVPTSPSEQPEGR